MRRHCHNPTSDRRGTVLILSLMVLSSVIIAAVGLSQLIINSLQQTKALDRATIAYYAAESGVEKAIWEVRHPVGDEDVLPRPVPDPDIQTITEVSLPNDAYWTRDVSVEEDEMRLAIPEYSFFEMHLFEPTEQLGSLGNWALGQTDVPAYLRVDWGDDQTICDPNGECPTLVAEWIRWPIDPLAFGSDSPEVFTRRYVPSSTNPGTLEETFPQVPTGTIAAVIPPDGIGFSDKLDLFTYAYRIRLRAENGNLRNVVVKAFDVFDNQAKLPGRVVVDGYGNFGGIVQRVTVRVPRRSPLSSLFDFAIFSECSLVKGYPISCP